MSSSNPPRPTWTSQPRALSGAGHLRGSREAQTPLSVPESARYEPGGVLGVGGMGEVRAVYDRRLGRMVARKTPRDADAATRLAAEARLTARLVHPGIVTVLDGGQDEAGRPCYTMPILHGRSLAEVMGGADTPARLRLVRHVLDAARAVGFAHSEGVLHRDLKAEHIFVGQFGETSVVDWGLAGPVGEAAPGIGTPGYMPPEQRRGDALTPAADVWSLGATLHELLIGQVPDDPPRPCGKARPDLPMDLATIVDRALRLDPADRYPDGTLLAMDLEAWYEGRRVKAHRYTAWELLGRLWAAWRVPILIVATALLAAMGAVTAASVRAVQQRDRAVAAEQVAQQALTDAERNLAQAEVARSLDATAQGDRAAAEVLATAALSWGPSPDAVGVLASFDHEARPNLLQREPLENCPLARPSPSGHRVACVNEDAVVVRTIDGSPPAITRIPGRFHRVAFGGDDRYLITLAVDDEAMITDLNDETPPFRLPALREILPRTTQHALRIPIIARGKAGWIDIPSRSMSILKVCMALPSGGAQAIEIFRDGTTVVACGDGGIWQVDATGATRLLHQLDPAEGPPLNSTSDGDRMLIVQSKGTLTVISATSGERIKAWKLPGATIMQVAMQGGRVAGNLDERGVIVWDIATTEVVARLPGAQARLRWLDHGRRLRVVSSTVADWLLPDRPPRPHVYSSSAGISSVAISPDGLTIASSHGDGHVRMARLNRSGFFADVALDNSVVKDLSFSPDGRYLAAVTVLRPEVVILDAHDGGLVCTLGAEHARGIAWLHEGLVSMAFNGGVQWWSDPMSGMPPLSIGGIARGADLEPWSDRHGASMLDTAGKAWLFVGEKMPKLQRLPIDPNANALSAVERQAVYVRESDVVYRSPHGVEKVVRIPDTVTQRVSADAGFNRAAVSYQDGTVRIWSLPDLSLQAVLRGHRSRVVGLAFSPDGQLLITGSWDQDMRVWSMRPLDVPAEVLKMEAATAWGYGAEEMLGELSSP